MPLFASHRVPLLLAWACLALTLQVSGGFYRPAGLAMVLVAATFSVWAATLAWMGDGATAETRGDDRLPACLLALMLGVSLLHPLGDAIVVAWFAPLARGGVALVGFALLAVVLWPRRPGLAVALAVVGFGVGIATRAALIVAAPVVTIDVFTMFQESAAHLLDGLNPYTTPVSDPYAGARDYGYRVFGYAYPPLNLYFQTLAYWVAHDIRVACLAADAVVAGALWRLGGGTRRGLWAMLLFLFFPRGPFVIEQAWTEPFIAAAYCGVALLATRYPGSRRLAIVYGLLLGLKQYLVYFVLHGLLLERRIRRIALAGLAVLVPLLPFLVVDARAFLDYAVLFQLNTPFRPDGLTIPAAVYALTGVSVGKGVAALAGLVAALASGWAFALRGVAGWLHATVLTTFTLFLTGSQAFANYTTTSSPRCCWRPTRIDRARVRPISPDRRAVRPPGR